MCELIRLEQNAGADQWAETAQQHQPAPTQGRKPQTLNTEAAALKSQAASHGETWRASSYLPALEGARGEQEVAEAAPTVPVAPSQDSNGSQHPEEEREGPIQAKGAWLGGSAAC